MEYPCRRLTWRRGQIQLSRALHPPGCQAVLAKPGVPLSEPHHVFRRSRRRLPIEVPPSNQTKKPSRCDGDPSAGLGPRQIPVREPGLRALAALKIERMCVRNERRDEAAKGFEEPAVLPQCLAVQQTKKSRAGPSNRKETREFYWGTPALNAQSAEHTFPDTYAQICNSFSP